jgi:hypothetical protein
LGGFVLIFFSTLKHKKITLAHWSLGLIFHLYEKMSNGSFSIQIIFVWKTISMYYIPKRQNCVCTVFIFGPMADIIVKFKVLSVVQHKKKTSSQQKQKREAKSNNTGCLRYSLCCH